VTICVVLIEALFQGRVIDKPEQTIMKSKYSTGGSVEHEVSMSFLCPGSVMYILVDLHDRRSPLLYY
jgi:hypothetical protein